MLKKLKNLGLTNTEIQIYLTALKSGPIEITSLSRIAGIKRTSTYSVVEKLINLGLLIEGKVNKQRIYQAENPSALVNFAKKQEENWKKAAFELNQLLPRLEKLVNKNKNNIHFPNVKVYEGSEMIQDVVEEFFKALKIHKYAYQIVDGNALLQLFGFDNFVKKVTRRKGSIKKLQFLLSLIDFRDMKNRLNY